MKELQDTISLELSKIPKERFWSKVRRTLTGLAFVAAAVAVVRWMTVPWYVPVALFGLGMNIISGDLIRIAAKATLAIGKDVVGLVKKNP